MTVLLSSAGSLYSYLSFLCSAFWFNALNLTVTFVRNYHRFSLNMLTPSQYYCVGVSS